jgi:enoyl-CoA hydratase/carnithine racemase
MSKDAPILLREDVGGIARLTLNRPRARNALSDALIAALSDALDALVEDGDAAVIVLAARGPAFCAGHDLKEMRPRKADADGGAAYYEDLFARCSAMMQRIVRHPKPVIAEVQGMATAAGCQLVASCDLAVASREARFATPGVNIGLFCSTPMVALTRNVPRKHAMEMLLTGEAVEAERARELGLVNRVVEPESLAAATIGLARQIADKSPLTVRVGKEAFYRQLELSLPEAYAFTSAVMTQNMLAEDAGEGIAAFLEKRAPTWVGA